MNLNLVIYKLQIVFANFFCKLFWYYLHSFSTFFNNFGYIIVIREPLCIIVNILILQSRGGGLSFLHTNRASLEEKISDENPASVLLAYLNGDHEYVIFNPYGEQEGGIAHKRSIVGFEETGKTPDIFHCPQIHAS